jgi:acyl-coenzyme A synthetase/AMP-(fatty) acid ligase
MVTPSPSAATAVPAALLASPLAAAARHLDRVAVVAAGRDWTWRQVHQAAMALAREFGDAGAVCNLCTSRLGFLVTFIAALRQQALTVLPPSGGNADLAVVLGSFAQPVIVVDDDAAIEAHWPAIARCVTWSPEAPATPADDLAWQPAWHETAALLYTSGSTGTPEPQPKTLLHLTIGALVLGERLTQDLGTLDRIERIVCSVPPQHMFGLEASVMLSVVQAIAVLDRRPLLPADVQSAFAESPPAAWIVTPLHLRGLVQAEVTVSNCRVVIASTMPLAPALAAQAEAAVNAPVLEIYGSTETGVLAMRRTATEADWLPVSGVQLEPTDEGAQAHGMHFESPARLLDRIEVGPDGRFTLLGRQADLIKIAGRRASLSGLNMMLLELPGLDDGVFYLPESNSGTERLCLFFSSATLDRGAVERWLRTRLDPVFVPRTIVRVDRLPRGDNGKLPRQALDRLHAQGRDAKP